MLLLPDEDPLVFARRSNAGESPLRQTAWRLGALALVLAVVGCGPSEPFQLAPVSGKITLDGQPLAGVKVRFQPVAVSLTEQEPGPGSYGETDADGVYTLLLIIDDRPGAVVGNHKVYLTAATQQAGTGEKADISAISGERIPNRFRDGQVEFSVPPEGSSSADFALTTR